MRKNYKNFILCLFLFICLLDLLLYRKLVFEAINDSLMLWIQDLLPSMFPFFVLSSILIEIQFSRYIPYFFKKFFYNIMGIRDTMVSIFILSMLSGFPNNARMIRLLYQQQDISLEEADRSLIFCHFSNPIFVFSVVGVIFLKNKIFGIIIWISIFLGNIILGIFTRNMTSTNQYDYTEKEDDCQSISKIIIHSIQSSIDSCLLILGILTCFFIFSHLVLYHIHLSIYSSTIVKGILEITMGIQSLSYLSISNVYKVVISTMFLSFGGLSVHMQVISQIADTDISYHSFLNARIIHSIISGLISFVLYYIFYM